jgi:radical S-adenosyl methionine domain-containing protein 2
MNNNTTQTTLMNTNFSTSNALIIPSVNFHLWEPCNMRCKFCFATFLDMKQTILPKGHLPKEQSLEVVRQLAAAGFQKITFVGGEPTLCPWLIELIQEAKKLGMNTGIVTNGTRLTADYLSELRPYLDWIGLSVDSLNEETNVSIGRAITGKKALNRNHYYELVELINSFRFLLKINTVVNRLNLEENLSEFIRRSKTSRWKVFQVLPIEGENDRFIRNFEISSYEFDAYLQRHSELGEILVPERNEVMKGSYAMVDPAGRFFENSTGALQYSQPILTVGVKEAYRQSHPSAQKFFDRGGVYDWDNTLTNTAKEQKEHLPTQ